MQLFYSPTSPFVRKCLVAAQELGLRAKIAFLPAAPHPVDRDRAIVAHNPLGKVPTLITDDGMALYDSRVICDYLNTLGDGRLVPAEGNSRWTVYRDQALGLGMMEAAVLVRYETFARPEPLRWKGWIDGQLEKVTCGLAQIEQHAGTLAERVDVGTISIGCALGYLDFRFASLGWRGKCPQTAAWFARFGERESMASTRPPAA
ncbi:MAG TPA: glutathione S-transferase N-terminal domain-containing protein [Steroidobacteraceae bacterium]|jgi:glutathione S-transferase|nr:glutathione S-transferase N-terminal domain-containing protein [Steroidobacteraceae bacterium]